MLCPLINFDALLDIACMMPLLLGASLGVTAGRVERLGASTGAGAFCSPEDELLNHAPTPQLPEDEPDFCFQALLSSDLGDDEKNGTSPSPSPEPAQSLSCRLWMMILRRQTRLME